MSTVKRITRNSVWQFASNLVQKAFSLIIVVILAKKFGVDNFGLYSFAFSFVAVFSIFADFGINNFLVREIARDSQNARKLLSNGLTAKLLLSILSFGAILLSGILLGLDNYKLFLVLLAGASLLLDGLAGLFRGVFFSFEIFKYETIVSFLYRSLLLGLSLGVFFFGFGLVELLIVAVVSSLFNLVASIYFTGKHAILPSFGFSFEGLFSIYRASSNFLLLGVVMNIFANADILLLQKFWSQTEVGLYSGAIRLVSTLTLVSVIFMNSVHPVATKFFAQNQKSMETVVNKSLFYLAVFILPVAIGTSILSKDIVLFFYDTDFLQTTTPLVILGFAHIFSFSNHVFITMLLSAKREKDAFKQMLFSTAFNVAANLVFFIPALSIVGAATAKLLAEMVSFSIGYFFVSKHIAPISLPKVYLRPLIAAVLMGITTVMFYTIAGFYLAVVLSALTYTVFLFAVKAFSEDDISFFKKMLFAFSFRK